ncbi:MAG: DMT family transporter [Acidimicrobiia bacterium]|nr:DMT family transporter [Acidimicrobiia bacterium]
MVVVLSLVAAAFFGASSVLMHTQARAAPAEQSLRPSLLVHLARQPAWLAGIGAQILGFALLAVALEMGSLSVVQAIAPVALLLALPLAARVSGKRLRRADWLGAAATIVGLGVALVIADPATGRAMPTTTGWTVLLTFSIGVSVALLVVGARLTGAGRAVALAPAAGIVLGLNTVFTKAAATQFKAGIGNGLTSWETYGVAVFGLAGLLLMQSAFQAGEIEWSLPTLTVINPVLSIAVGLVLLDETVAAHGVAIIPLVISLAVMVWGVVSLARSPALVAIHEQPA